MFKKIGLHDAVIHHYIALLFFGVPIFAALSNILSIDSMLGSIFVRSIILLMACVVILQGKLNRGSVCFLVVFLAFGLIYFFRMNIELMLENIEYTMPAEQAYLFFVSGVLLPSMSIFFIGKHIGHKYLIDKVFIYALIFCVMFVFFSTNDKFFGRYAFDSVNPITCGLLSIFLSTTSIFKFRDNVLLTTVLLALSAYVSIKTGSRSAMIIQACIIILFFFNQIYKSTKENGFIKLAFLVLVIILLYFYMHKILENMDVDILINRLFETTSMSDTGRDGLFYYSWLAFMDSPLFGCCLITPVINYYPHNVLLESMIATGAIGTFMLMFLISACFIVMLYRRGLYIKCYFSMFFISLVFSMVTGGILLNVYFWIAMFLLLNYGFRSEEAV